MSINNYDEGMAKFIWHDILQTSPIPLSWGIDFSTVRVITGGTSFHVQGFNVTGAVNIEYQEGSDLFKVKVLPDDGSAEIIREDVYSDTLISTIDEIVEKTDDYESRICQEYGLAPKAKVA